MCPSLSVSQVCVDVCVEIYAEVETYADVYVRAYIYSGGKTTRIARVNGLKAAHITAFITQCETAASLKKGLSWILLLLMFLTLHTL